MKVIDLSHIISNQLPVYPGDDSIEVIQNKNLENHGYVNTIINTGMHVGTHIDTSAHLLNRSKLVHHYPLENFIGRGCLLNVVGEEVIKMKSEYIDLIKENDIVLIHTGFDRYFGHDSYYNRYPILDDELAEFLIKRKIKMIGMDTPSPDYYPFMIHKKLFEQDILIIENLTNLEKLIDIPHFEVHAIPLNIQAEASIARVFAKVD